MSKKTFDQEENKPFEYFKEGEAAKKQEKSDTDNLITSLRADMVLTSSTSPAKKNIFERINLKYLFGILLTLFIIIFLWFWLGGPGRPILEHNLALLVKAEASSTQPVFSSVILPTATSLQPTITPFPSPTIRPTNTPTVRIMASPTNPPLTATPTSPPACREALTITLADVGQTLCVQGTVIQTADKPNGFMVFFNTQPGTFYWVAYDLVWSQAKLDICYQTSGTIQQLGTSPVLIFNYKNLPELCP